MIIRRTGEGGGGDQNYTLLPMRALNASAWLCLQVHTEPHVLLFSVRFLWLIVH